MHPRDKQTRIGARNDVVDVEPDTIITLGKVGTTSVRAWKQYQEATWWKRSRGMRRFSQLHDSDQSSLWKLQSGQWSEIIPQSLPRWHAVAKRFHGFIYYDNRYSLLKLFQYVNVAAAHVKEGATPIIRPFREILPFSTNLLL